MKIRGHNMTETELVRHLLNGYPIYRGTTVVGRFISFVGSYSKVFMEVPKHKMSAAYQDLCKLPYLRRALWQLPNGPAVFGRYNFSVVPIVTDGQLVLYVWIPDVALADLPAMASALVIFTKALARITRPMLSPLKAYVVTPYLYADARSLVIDERRHDRLVPCSFPANYFPTVRDLPNCFGECCYEDRS